jgi:hypothetical protein
MSALDRLKSIQSNFKKNWTGILTEHSGRPGTSLLMNKKRVFTVAEAQLDDDERMRTLLKIFGKLKEFEDDRATTANSIASSTTSFNKHSST